MDNLSLMENKKLERIAAKLRVMALEAMHEANYGYTGSVMSVMEIVAALYFGVINDRQVMRVDPKKSQWDERDFLVFSKGHAAPALYAALAQRGFFAEDELKYFAKVGGLLTGFPSVKIPGVDATTGSLGQGLSVSVGLALSLKLDKKPNKVYTILGDAELQEGQNWEAAMSAAHYRLDNMIAFVDRNKLQMDGRVAQIMEIDPIFEKFTSFGWYPIRIIDGHNFDMLLEAINKAWNVKRKPVVIICNTIKGKGIPFAEHKAAYSRSVLSDAEMEEVLPLLRAQV